MPWSAVVVAEVVAELVTELVADDETVVVAVVLVVPEVVWLEVALVVRELVGVDERSSSGTTSVLENASPLASEPETTPRAGATAYTAFGVVRYTFTTTAVSSAASQLRNSPEIVSFDTSPVPNAASDTAVRTARASAADSAEQLLTPDVTRTFSVSVFVARQTFHVVSWMSATIEFRSTMATVHSEMTGKSTKSDGSHASEASALPFRYAANRDPTAPAVLAQFVPPCSSTNSPSAEVWHSTSPDAAPPHSADPALITRLAPSHASNAASAEANAAISRPTSGLVVYRYFLLY